MKEVLQNFPKGISIWFFIFMIASAIIIRVILSFFKASAHNKGETTAKTNNKSKSYWKYFRQSLLSSSGKHEIDDDFIPFIIGMFELTIIPYFLENSLFRALAAWFAFKAIGTWATNNSRTANNRFLLGNILSIIASWLLWKCFF